MNWILLNKAQSTSIHSLTKHFSSNSIQMLEFKCAPLRDRSNVRKSTFTAEQNKVKVVSVDSKKNLHYIFDTSYIQSVRERENWISQWALILIFILFMRAHDTEWESKKNIQEFLTQSIIDSSVLWEWLIANDPLLINE